MRVSLVSFRYAAYRKQQKLLLSCPNLMVSLPIDAPSTASMAKALRRQKTLFGMHKVYQDADAAAYLLSLTTCIPRWNRVSFSFWSQMIRAQRKYPGCFRCCSTVPLHPHTAILPDRSAGRLPQIEQIITANPAYLLLLPDHMARTLDTPTVSFEELSLRNIFTVNCSQMHKVQPKRNFISLVPLWLLFF